jgi:hypothetical protein
MPSIECHDAAMMVHDFAMRHDNMFKFMSETMRGLAEKIAVVSDSHKRMQHINMFISLARESLSSYQATHNQFLRTAKRRLKYLIEHCDGGSSKLGQTVMKAMIAKVTTMHDTVDAIIRSVFMYAAQESNDDGSLKHVVRSLADLRDQVAESQSNYVQAYSSLNFVMVLIDRHFVWVMGIKAFKAVLVYMGVMMAQRMVLDYHDRHPELDNSKKFNFTLFPLYLSVILLFIDVCIVMLMFFVGKVIGFFSSSTFLRSEASLWSSLLRDAIVTDAFAIVFCFMLAHMFRHKRYLKSRDDPRLNLQSLTTLSVRVLLVNCMIPYFMAA